MSDENETAIIARPSGNGNGIQRTGFGSSELENRRETQSAALAERAKAEVQARFIVALQRPRDIDEVRVRLLKHCKRKRFAEVAEYAKPVGGRKITGPSIRFVETALQEYGNVVPEVTVSYDDDEKRIVRVSVTDLERNVSYYEDATVEKFVERRQTKGGDEVISSRTNSYGDLVYRIRANEDDFANKQAAAVSKKLRNLGLRILPADIVDEAMDLCATTRRSEVEKDPDSERKKIADAFFALNVTPSHLSQYLGAPVDQASPADMDALRVIYTTIKDGEAKWAELLDAKKAERNETAPSKGANAAAAKVREKIAARKTGNGQATEKAPEKDGGQ